MLYDPNERRIRSFVTRAGRLSDAQARALEQLGPKYMISYQKEVTDLNTAFPRSAPLVLEIGFGMGQSLVELATREPQTGFIGIEVHRPGVGKLLALAE